MFLLIVLTELQYKRSWNQGEPSLRIESEVSVGKVFSRCKNTSSPVGTVSLGTKYYKDAENVDAPLVMMSIGGRKMTLAGKTVYHNGSIDTSFVLTHLRFSLNRTFTEIFRPPRPKSRGLILSLSPTF